MSGWNDNIVAEFRANHGAVGGPYAGAHLLLLTTIGAKSGEKRLHPVMYFADGERRVIVASKGGHPKHPAWYHNLLANSHVHVEAAVDGGIDEYDTIATPLPEGEREAFFSQIVAMRPQFGKYQEKTERIIPLIGLRRV
jgi:deazaflavin-dependent oxidoreductase (nitroreductase family)